MSRLTRLDASSTSLEVLSEVVTRESPVLLAGRASVLFAAALADRSPVAGVWVHVDATYPAPLVARDVATLAWITPLEHVVVEGEGASAHRAAIAALLTDDEVTFSNEAATLVAAYNRPAPPRPLTLWHAVSGALIGEGATLVAGATRSSEAGELLDYA